MHADEDAHKSSQIAGEEGMPDLGAAEAVPSPVKQLRKLFGQTDASDSNKAEAMLKGLGAAFGRASSQAGKASDLGWSPTVGVGKSSQGQGSKYPSGHGRFSVSTSFCQLFLSTQAYLHQIDSSI